MRSSLGDVPLWLWRLVRVGFTGTLIIGLAAIIALAGGAADPQRAGPLAWEKGPRPEIAIPPRTTFMLDNPIQLPAPPFTLEVTAQLAASSDPAASWGLQFDSSTFGIILNGYRFMAVLPGDLTPFIHVRGTGEANKLTVDVDNQNQATLRVNDEIAWHGIIPPLRTVKITVHGGANGPAQFIVQHVALFIPH